jgi:hypothetical protein
LGELKKIAGLSAFFQRVENGDADGTRLSASFFHFPPTPLHL